MTKGRVLVVGGGPAGSTAAALLAREGVDVAVFEREAFPRYHIGESILPACHPIMDLLGVKEKIANAGFRIKQGVYLNWGEEQWDYRFGALTGNLISTWQVERGDFDKILLDHARAQGASVFERRRVTDLHFDGDRPVAASWTEPHTGRSGREEFEYLIDASGRYGLMCNKYLNNRQVHASFRNVAIWGYWNDCGEIAGAPVGATIISSVPEGWIWVIPLRDGVSSVGVVLHKDRLAKLREQGDTPELVYHDMLRQARDLPWILEKATFRGEISVEQDYSYAANSFAGPGYFIAGDAACFLDPLLSTGVHLAMFSAMLASAAICTNLRGEFDERTVQTFYEESYRRTYLRFLLVVAAVYQQYAGKETYFWQAQQLRLREHDPDQPLLGSFLHVVSGVADFDEVLSDSVTDETVARVGRLFRETHHELQERVKLEDLEPDEREHIRARAQFWNSFVSAFSVNPETAVNNLYVSTKPRLALRAVRQPEEP